jgi:hypothetical protein
MTPFVSLIPPMSFRKCSHQSGENTERPWAAPRPNNSKTMKIRLLQLSRVNRHLVKSDLAKVSVNIYG